MDWRIDPKVCEPCLWINDPATHWPRWGEIVRLGRNGGLWMLNHYGGKEALLGWMALSPVRHVEQIHQLDADELQALGGHLQSVSCAPTGPSALRMTPSNSST
jgi:hypothetical protein